MDGTLTILMSAGIGVIATLITTYVSTLITSQKEKKEMGKRNCYQVY